MIKRVKTEEKIIQVNPRFQAIDRLKKQTTTKCTFTNYKIDLPINEPRPQTAFTLPNNGSQITFPLSRPVTVKTNEDRRKLCSAKSEVRLLYESATVFSNDACISPSFLLSSQKEISNIAKNKRSNWKMIGTNDHYLCYKPS